MEAVISSPLSAAVVFILILIISGVSGWMLHRMFIGRKLPDEN